MSEVFGITVPIKLQTGVRSQRTHYLNLNNYRNWHFQLKNELKRKFQTVIAEDVRQLGDIHPPCRITYEIFYPTKRKFDIDNIGSVLCKFTQDALVEQEILDDDNYEIVKEIVFKFGGIDKDNPRCEVYIEELDLEEKDG